MLTATNPLLCNMTVTLLWKPNELIVTQQELLRYYSNATTDLTCHNINQIKCFVLKTRTLLKLFCASSANDVHEPHCGHPWHIQTSRSYRSEPRMIICCTEYVSCRWRGSMSLNCGHHRAYCSLLWVWSPGGMALKLGRNPVPVPECPPQVPHGLNPDSAMRMRLLK
jgi:hypothetical protein